MNVTAINKSVITWARAQCNIGIEELALRMGKTPQDIRDWEDPAKDSFPSIVALEDLAYKHLKVPLAVFFFPEPPRIERAENKFRRLPQCELQRFTPDTFFKLRLALGYQNSLRDLLSIVPQKPKIFQVVDAEQLDSAELAEKVREFIGVSISQQLSYRSSKELLKVLRFAIEEAGVFAFKDSFVDRFVSGFCIVDDEYPVIMINNSNAFSRQLFTLLHELGHILYGVNGVTDVDESYIEEMSSDERSLEVKCNKFAAEFLVPASNLKLDIKSLRHIADEDIALLAEKYSVSREVVLRRLLDLNKVTNSYYLQKALEWNKDYLRSRKEKGKGDYYWNQLTYLGEGFVSLAFHNYRLKRIGKVELAQHLNIKAANINKLESYLRR